VGVSTFPIRDERTSSSLFREFLFFDVKDSFGGVTDVGGFLQLEGAIEADNVKVGDAIWVDGGANYDQVNGLVTGTGNQTILTDIPFNGGGSGTYTTSSGIRWKDDTPKNNLREIHVQMLLDNTVQIEVTFDNVNYFAINNNGTLLGVSTFTMFVTDDSRLNFRTNTDLTLGYTIIVTSA